MSAPKKVTFTPVMSATPDYAAGDAIGTSMLIATNFFDVNKSKRLVAISARDKAGVGPDFTVYLFNAAPVGGTYTDNAAFAPSTADQAAFIGQASLVAANYKNMGAIKSGAADVDRLVGPGTGSLWAVVAADGAYNGASTADLTIDLIFE